MKTPQQIIDWLEAQDKDHEDRRFDVKVAMVMYANEKSKAHLEAIKSLAIQANRKPSGLEEIINYCNEQLKGL